MTALVTALQLGLAVTFLVAAAGKALGFADFAGVVRASRLPAPLVTPVAVALPIVEATVALSVVLTRGRVLTWALGAAGALLVAFTAWMTSVVARGIALRCGCFGASRREIGTASLARNAALVVAAGAAAWLSTRAPSALPAADLWSVVAASCGAMTIALGVAFSRARSALALSLDHVRDAAAPVAPSGRA